MFIDSPGAGQLYLVFTKSQAEGKLTKFHQKKCAFSGQRDCKVYPAAPEDPLNPEAPKDPKDEDPWIPKYTEDPLDYL